MSTKQWSILSGRNLCHFILARLVTISSQYNQEHLTISRRPSTAMGYKFVYVYEMFACMNDMHSFRALRSFCWCNASCVYSQLPRFIRNFHNTCSRDMNTNELACSQPVSKCIKRASSTLVSVIPSSVTVELRTLDSCGVVSFDEQVCLVKYWRNLLSYTH